MFRGAGWNVIKVVWGSRWDELLQRDVDGVLLNKMNTTVDGAFQRYAVESGAYIREKFFGPDPRLRKLVEHLSDDDLRNLPRGGHDYQKVYAAYKAAIEHHGQPTVILAKTVKGWTLGAGLREPQRHPPDQEDDQAAAAGAAGPAQPRRGDPPRRPGGRHPALLPAGQGLRGVPVHDGPAPGPRRSPSPAPDPASAGPCPNRSDVVFKGFQEGSGAGWCRPPWCSPACCGS